MVKISSIEKNSIAAKFGLEPGDKIITINGEQVLDYIDFQYKTADNFFILGIKKKDNSFLELEVERDYGEKLGIEFDKIISDRLKICKNNCLFCFVKQLPDGLRNTLHKKDDDYRFSFLQGSFITLTNLSEDEFERIISMRLSPLNISVHTTNPVLRKEMMRNPEAGKIMSQLKKLAKTGIKFNTQVVLCPGLNDEKELDRTIKDLSELTPNLISLGIVPVGLTKFRENNYPLKSFDKNGARQVLEKVDCWQEYFRKKTGKNWIYAADELYLLADENIPDYEHYNGFPQLENGIGLTRLLWAEYEQLESIIPTEVKEKEIGIITSVLGKKALKPIVKKLNNIIGLKMKLIEVENKFFGSSVTVTGLLTGQDIISTLKNDVVDNYPDKIILPGVAVNDNNLFLDDVSFADICESITNKKLYLCSNLEEIIEVIKNA